MFSIEVSLKVFFPQIPFGVATAATGVSTTPAASVDRFCGRKLNVDADQDDADTVCSKYLWTT